MSLLPVEAQTVVYGQVPLSITTVTVERIGPREAAISWTTNGPSTSQVIYDTRHRQTTKNYEFDTDVDTTLVTRHSVVLRGLDSHQKYYFRVRSKDGDLIAVSKEASFRTLKAPSHWRFEWPWRD
jgi:hypothetical protein